jgi:hypothetical protein|tara:strand:- start:10423 stop:10710 length:288 start_codon:yes stop_codon:yes gene_type:complete
MDRHSLIDNFLLDFKPKKDQSWKSCYFFAYYLKKKHKIDAELIEGISRINKIDYWIVRFNGSDEDIHAKAVGIDADFIDNPEVVWSLKDFEKDNF